MKPVFFKCPECGTKFDAGSVIRRPGEKSFACPNCKRQLTLSAADKWITFISWLMISCLITYFRGIGDPFAFLGVTLCILFVGAVPFALITRRIIPPRLELYYPEN